MAIRSISAFAALDLNTFDSRPNRSPKLRRLIAAGCLGLMMCGSTGCTLTSGITRAIKKSDHIDNFMIDYRNRAMAEKAWHCQKDHFGNRKHAKEFKQGFIDGYLEVANGGNGCCPSVAPPQYWGWRYQSAQGQAAVNAWFAGFPMGARAAEQDGVGHWQVVRPAGTHSVHSTELIPATMDPHAPVANPFYSEEHILPGEIIHGEGGPIEMDLNDSYPEIIQPQPYEGAYHETLDDRSIEDSDELVSRFEADPEPASAGPAEEVFKDQQAQVFTDQPEAIIAEQPEEILAQQPEEIFAPQPEVIYAEPAPEAVFGGESAAIDDIFAAADEGTASDDVSSNDTASDELPFSFD